jgi:hypothetical protein
MARKQKRKKNKLSKRRRAALPSSAFALPKQRKFPMQSAKQAVTALTYARWPQNQPRRAAVERAVYKQWPKLQPTPRQRLAGHVAPPAAARRKAQPRALQRVANGGLVPGVAARAARELEPVRIVRVSGPEAVVRLFDGSLASYPLVELQPLRANRPAPVASPVGLQRQITDGFARRGWRTIYQRVNCYAYPPHKPRSRYQIAADGVHPQTHGRRGWEQAGRSVPLQAALAQLQRPQRGRP